MIFQSELKYLAASILAVSLTSGTAFASLTSESRAALSQLRSQNSAAAKVSSRAVVKAGFIFGAQGGEGILFVHGKTAGRYRTVAASYGLQAGVQKKGYALFFMKQKAGEWINKKRGLEIWSGPSVGIGGKGRDPRC